MFTRLELWWKENEIPQILGITAVATILTVILFTVILSFAKIVTSTISWLSIWWIVYWWVGASSAYVLGLLWFEYRAYKREPDDYSFWGKDKDDDDDEAELGV